MEPVVVSCDGCGGDLRVSRPVGARDRSCPVCGTPLAKAPAQLDWRNGSPADFGTGPECGLDAPERPLRFGAATGVLLALAAAFLSFGFGLGGSPDTRSSVSEGVPLSVCESRHDRPSASLTTAPQTCDPPRSLNSLKTTVAQLDPTPKPDPPRLRADVTPAVPPPAADAPGKEPRRIRVRTRSGKNVVARVHGEVGGEVHIILPDGQLGIPNRPAFTDEPFQPAMAAEIEQDLLDGAFSGFKVLRKQHYLIVYQSSEEFAEESGRVLESLYKGLTDAFRKFDVPVREAEFPLVVVIFRTERDFRAHKPVDPEIQAYYEIYSNRIFFYETSDRDEQAPEVAALRRPQTVAHEGTHQILQNIGIQPRLAAWPPWLIEGLAEYCSTPLATKKRGPTWSGLGLVNPLHLATIRDLDDPLSGQVTGSARPEHIGRRPGMPLVEYLVTKTDLTPTDYALAWAMTHYLAMKRVDEFIPFLKAMSSAPPLQPMTPEDHLAAFRGAFGDDLKKLDREIGKYLSKLKIVNHLPYYAVMFQQRVGVGLVKRAAIVSQSPSMIRQWLDTVTTPRGDIPAWEALSFASRTPALVTAEAWVRGQ